jgi:phosphoribosylamine---glycine ligase
VTDHAPFAAHDRRSVFEHDLEPQHHALRTRLRADQNDARARERFELALQKRFFARVRSHHADGDRRAHLFGHTEIKIRYRGLCVMHDKSVLIVGSGAREHALAVAFVSEKVRVVCAPGNAGTARIAKNVLVGVENLAGLVAAARSENVSFVVVGPELPLTLGLVDAIGQAKIPVFGPSRAAARLEGSKHFMKQICVRAGVKTAAFETFDDADRAEAYVRSAKRPLVVKADGLAAGKGVTVASSAEEACKAIHESMREKRFGDAGNVVVIEELLAGREASFHVVCSERGIFPLVAAQDHKRLLDDDRGPNTGGMGAYAPAPIITRELEKKIIDQIISPTLEAMRAEGAPFSGVLFAGLMIDDGEAQLLEFNVRFGDPETSVLAPLTRGLYDLLLASALGESLDARASIDRDAAAVSVVMAADGYPGNVKTGDVIEGIDVAEKISGAHVLHAGTKLNSDGVLVTSGGRILNVVGHGDSFESARERAYAAVDQIHFRGAQARRDIGAKRN